MAAGSKRGMTAQGCLFAADGQNQRAIHVQRFDGRAANRGQTHETNPLPCEVVLPSISPRIEEGHISATLRIHRRLTCSLAEREDRQAKARFSATVCPPAFAGTAWS